MCLIPSVFIHPAGLCFLVGAFNLFTFKVTVDIYDPIAVVLTVLSLFFVGLFLLLFFLLREVSFHFISCCSLLLVPFAFYIMPFPSDFC